MTMLVSAYRFAAPTGFISALAHKNATQSPGTSAALTWQVDDYDYGGWHDTSSNTSRFTVPSGVSLARFTSHRAAPANNPGLDHRLNGSAFLGRGMAESDASGTTNYMGAASAPIAVSPGDYFETFATASSGTNGSGSETQTWCSVERLDPATRYALVHNNAAQSFTASTNTTLNFNTEVVDTSSFHDNVTNNSRLTVPSGVTLVRLTANIEAVVGDIRLSILKGGASARGLPVSNQATGGNDVINLFSAPLVVSTSDYFELQTFATGAGPTTVITNLGTWFAIEEVIESATYKRALVNKTGSQSTVANTPVAVAWDAEVYDTGTIHDNATNNTRLTVPSGCTRARPCGAAKFANAAQDVRVSFQKNGADYYGQAWRNSAAAGADHVSEPGAWVEVVPGDYFEMIIATSGANSVTNDNETWFCLECE